MSKIGKNTSYVDQQQLERFGNRIVRDLLHLQLEFASLQNALIEAGVISEAQLLAAREQAKRGYSFDWPMKLAYSTIEHLVRAAWLAAIDQRIRSWHSRHTLTTAEPTPRTHR